MTNLLIVGLPASGKSTFLGALFHVLKTGTSGLTLAKMPDEREYLLELESQWLRLKPMERSRHHGPKPVQLDILVDGVPTQLNVPDIVGEDYEAAWEDGTWSEAVDGCVTAADGLMLFVRADHVDEPELIENATPTGTGQRDEDRAPWKAECAPTQAKLCDLLEQIAEHRGGDLPPIALVVTAWDSVAEEGLSPSQWLTWKLPLLDQWLIAQALTSRMATFGISAQGGNLGDEATRQALAINADTRPIPEGAVELGEPVRWLLATLAT